MLSRVNITISQFSSNHPKKLYIHFYEFLHRTETTGSVNSPKKETWTEEWKEEIKISDTIFVSISQIKINK